MSSVNDDVSFLTVQCQIHASNNMNNAFGARLFLHCKKTIRMPRASQCRYCVVSNKKNRNRLYGTGIQTKTVKQFKTTDFVRRQNYRVKWCRCINDKFCHLTLNIIQAHTCIYVASRTLIFKFSVQNLISPLLRNSPILPYSPSKYYCCLFLVYPMKYTHDCAVIRFVVALKPILGGFTWHLYMS